MPEKLKKIRPALYGVLGTLVILTIFYSLFHVASLLPQQASLHVPATRELEGWTEEGTATASGEQVYTLSMPAEELVDQDMLVWNEGQTLSIFLNDHVFCTMSPRELSETIQINGVAMVSIPECSGLCTLKLTIVPDDGGSVTLPRILLGSHYSLVKYIVVRDAPTLIMLGLLLLLAIVVFLTGTFFSVYSGRRERLAGLMLFFCSGFLWAITDSSLYLFFGFRLEIAAMVCYYAFMALPVPVLMQCRMVAEDDGPLIQVTSLLLGLNLVLQAILSTLGLVQLNHMVIVTQMLMLLTLAVCLITMHRTLGKSDNPYLRIYFYDTIGLAVIGLLALLLYWAFGSKVYRVLTLFGLLLFHAIVEVILLLEYRDEIHTRNREKVHSEVLKNLSYTDSMTGLPNRRAFDNRVNEITGQADKENEALLLMMDLNGLKNVNDTCGHNAGDELIRSAAHCLRDAYEDLGFVFRIGGDEFTVVIDHVDHSLTWYIDLLRGKTAEFNEKIEYKLSFAVGGCYLHDESGAVRSPSDWMQEADNAMYSNKSAMKREMRGESGNLRDVIGGIVRAVDARDGNTAEHSVRVAAMSVFLAEKAGLEAEDVQCIQNAAQLHNLGNISVPDSILIKPGNLTDEEIETVKRHVVTGSAMVGRAAGLERVARIILQHHERWDGRGYPDGIKGEEIDIGARIICLCDTIEAMTSPRSFRPALSWDECRAEVESNLGRQFDPKIGRLALDNWNDIIDIKLKNIRLL